MTGDLAGKTDVERAIEIAEGVGSPEVIRGYNNLATMNASLGDLERAFALYAEATGAAQRFGRVRALRWLGARHGIGGRHRRRSLTLSPPPSAAVAPAGAAATHGPDPADPPARALLAPARRESSASPPPTEPDERPARRSRQRTHPARRRVHPALPPTGVDGRCVNTVDSTVGHRHSRDRDRATVRPARRAWRAGLVAD